ncbi:hypothetical protein Anas_06111 [Armadillidium nasatum]|uniref:Uncharacterized protein n=1 Tax=Armadillidium nasatum TaxID=96803 RepID=A0A5N5ST12_9CRUS|nr:hypothetical protein Anas_06111 [Armadillidium nasatum]
MFKELRDEFSWYLSTHFSSSDDDDTMDFETMLDQLTRKFLDDPNDPYIIMKENVKKEWLHFLLSSHIILRHPNDPFKFRLTDFRRN